MNFQSASGNKFTLNVGVQIDSSSAGKQIRSQLRELEAVSVVNIKAKFDGKDAIKQVTTYKDALGRLVETQKIFNSQMKQLKTEEITKTRADGIRNLTKETETNVSATGRLITRTKEYKDGLLQCVNVTQQYRDAQGQLVTQTQKLDASGNKLGATQKQIVNDTRTVTTEINKYIDAQGREITQTTKLNAQRDGEVERIIKARTVEGGLITTTEKLRVVQGQEIEATREETQVIERNTQVTKDNVNSKKSLGDSFKNQLGITNDFISTMGKVIKFQIITKIITGFTTACRESIQVVKEFDSALTEFKKVSDLSGEALDSYTQRLGELGEAVARTKTQMVEASTQFKKSGFSDEDSAKLAQVSALYQNIADSELSAGESASFIISQMKAFREEFDSFNDEASKAVHIINSVNNVSNHMAVSSSDIALALSKTSSAMSALGNNYEESIALVTSG